MRFRFSTREDLKVLKLHEETLFRFNRIYLYAQRCISASDSSDAGGSDDNGTSR